MSTTRDNVRKLRAVADMAQEEQCEVAGVTRSTERVELSGYEREVIAKLRDCPKDVREAVLTLLDAIVD